MANESYRRYLITYTEVERLYGGRNKNELICYLRSIYGSRISPEDVYSAVVDKMSEWFDYDNVYYQTLDKAKEAASSIFYDTEITFTQTGAVLSARVVSIIEEITDDDGDVVESNHVAYFAKGYDLCDKI